MFSKRDFMLCEKITEKEIPFLKGEYKAQIKMDGERIVAFIENGEVALINRRGKICNMHFREVVEALKLLPNCILDGEIISYDNDFQKLQSRALTTNPFKQMELQKTIPVRYMIFDILKANEKDLRNLPLKERLKYLPVALISPFLELVEYDEVNNMVMIAREQNCEGIIIKDMNGIYEGRRSKNWLKFKFFQEQEMLIISAIQNPAGYRCEDKEGNAVQIAGRQSLEVIRQLNEKGQVNIIVQYLTKSKEGRMRFPSYRGLKC